MACTVHVARHGGGDLGATSLVRAGRVPVAGFAHGSLMGGAGACCARYHGRSVDEDQRKGSVCGFDGHKRVNGRKRHIFVDVLGIPLANPVGAANISDSVVGSTLLAGLPPLWPTIRTIIADADHESGKLVAQLQREVRSCGSSTIGSELSRSAG